MAQILFAVDFGPSPVVSLVDRKHEGITTRAKITCFLRPFQAFGPFRSAPKDAQYAWNCMPLGHFRGAHRATSGMCRFGNATEKVSYFPAGPLEVKNPVGRLPVGDVGWGIHRLVLLARSSVSH